MRPEQRQGPHYTEEERKTKKKIIIQQRSKNGKRHIMLSDYLRCSLELKGLCQSCIVFGMTSFKISAFKSYMPSRLLPTYLFTLPYLSNYLLAYPPYLPTYLWFIASKGDQSLLLHQAHLYAKQRKRKHNTTQMNHFLLTLFLHLFLFFFVTGLTCRPAFSLVIFSFVSSKGQVDFCKNRSIVVCHSSTKILIQEASSFLS